jgi:two-component sensor histidine kinase
LSPLISRHLQNIGKKLLNIGTHYRTDPYILRTARFINLFSLITIAGLLIGAFNILFIGKNYPFIAESLFLLLSIVAILCNKLHFYTAAVYCFLLTLNSSIFYVNEYYDPSAGPYLFYFPLILCVALLHNPTAGIKRTISYFVLSIIFIFTSLFYDFDVFGHANIGAAENSTLFIYDIAFSVVISALLVVLVIKLLDGQNVELTEALKIQQLNQEKLSLSVKDKEVLLQEIHHRVKNNLSVISSLLNLQINTVQHEESKQILADARNRVLSMSLVHQKLYKGSDLNKIKFNHYLLELSNDLLTLSTYKNKILLNDKLDECELDISMSIPLGLIINEIITNCIKHAFNDSITIPTISLMLANKIHHIEIIISDNGIGFDHQEKIRSSPSLGLSLIDTLIEQIDGKIEINVKKGSEYKISVPLK